MDSRELEVKKEALPEVLDRAHQEEQKGIALLFLDQEKAYDRVAHRYLWKLMKAYGIPSKLRKVVQALYKGSYLTAYVNGFKTDPILIKSGVRQGCSLSCGLFNLASEPFALIVQQDERIKGVQLENGTSIKLNQFADDTLTFLQDQQDLDIVCNEKIPTWGKGSGMNRVEAMVLGRRRTGSNLPETRGKLCGVHRSCHTRTLYAISREICLDRCLQAISYSLGCLVSPNQQAGDHSDLNT